MGFELRTNIETGQNLPESFEISEERSDELKDTIKSAMSRCGNISSAMELIATECETLEELTVCVIQVGYIHCKLLGGEL